MPENRGHMPPMQPSIEILSGFGTFTRVITRGKRYEKQSIKAFVFSSLSKRTCLHVGYAVSKKIRRAAHRNRLKRLMKEAFRARREDFCGRIDTGMLLEIVFLYNGGTRIPRKKVRFVSINQALTDLSSTINTV